MLELIAQGNSTDARWRRQLPEGTTIELGRATRPWSVAWDKKVSRIHFRMILVGGKLKVEQLPEASNPVFYLGNEATSFTVKPGEHFVVGETTFTLTDDRAFATQNVPSPISQRTFSQEVIQQISYRDADRRIEVLNRLPKAIAKAGDNEKDLMIRVVNLLLNGIQSASSIAVIKIDEQSADGVEIIHWDRRLVTPGDFQPSERLISQAIGQEETVLHVWGAGEQENADYTVDYENDWAFVYPLGEPDCRGWGIYVSGRNRIGTGSATDSGSDNRDLQGDIKFTELVGSTLATVLQVKFLERRQSGLRPFFAPVVLDAFAGQSPEEILTPRECDVSVLFCDLQGFSKASEEMANDLLALLDRVSCALGIMTRNTMENGGVIGDFHGDSAMGFWGWPLEQDDAPEQACRAAIAIHDELNSSEQRNPLDKKTSHEFKMGIGIASGSAVAGKIGTSDQVKVSVFGPVVNLSSRMEGLTRQIGAGILIDGTTFQLTKSAPNLRARKIATIQPYGLNTQTEVYQLLTEHESFSEEHLAAYESALDQFEKGGWQSARPSLLKLAPHDSAAQFLIDQMLEKDSPPDGFSGVVVARSK